MTRRMVRCVQGHPFDVGAHETCPICASREAKSSAASSSDLATGGQRQEPLPPAQWYKHPVVLAAVGVAALGAVVYALQPKAVPPEPPKQTAPEPRPAPAPAPAPPQPAPTPPAPAPQSAPPVSPPAVPEPAPAPAPVPPPSSSQQTDPGADRALYTQRILVGLAQNSTDIAPPWIKRREPADQWAVGTLDEVSKKAFDAAPPNADATKALMLLMSGYFALSKDDLPAALGRFEAGYYFGCGVCAYALAADMIKNPAYQRQRDRAVLWMAIAERIGIAEAGHYVAFYGQGPTEVKLMRAPTPAGGMKVGAYTPRESFLLSYARMSHYSLEMVDLARRGDQTAKNTLQRIGVDVGHLPLTTYELATQILRAGNAPRKEDLAGLVDMAASGDAAALNMLGEKYPPNPAFEFDFSMQVAMNQAAALRGKELAMVTTATLVSSMGRPEVATPGGMMTNVDSAIFAFAGLALANSANSKPLAPQLDPFLARLTPAERGALEPYFKSLTPVFGKRW